MAVTPCGANWWCCVEMTVALASLAAEFRAVRIVFGLLRCFGEQL